VLTVKPDGTRLFLAWYDRRNDTNNSLIDVYARWGTIERDGSVALDPEFRINTVSFPPVFAGTLTNNIEQGHYDPVYPPGVNLHWWYPEWPDDEDILASPIYASHVGEYNGIASDGEYVWLTWTDNRMQSGGTSYIRGQSDIRLARLPWPPQ